MSFTIYVDVDDRNLLENVLRFETDVVLNIYPGVRTGSSIRNTQFFPCFCFGHLPQTPSFRSAKQIFVANFGYTTWARILNDRNIFCTLGERDQQQWGLMPLGLFLFAMLSRFHLRGRAHDAV